MKKILLLTTLMLSVLTPAQSIAQVSEKFIGHWEDQEGHDNNVSSDDLIIKKDTAIFVFSDYDFKIICRPKYKEDTILFYISDYNYLGASEPGDSSYPKRKTLLAKCYMQGEQMQIIPARRSFRKLFHLPAVLYKFVPDTARPPAQKQFSGTWYDVPADKDDAWPVLMVSKNEVMFTVMINQLDLGCMPKYVNDTLLLYIISRDCGRMFYSGDEPLPKLKTLFAKCYIKGKRLHIIYTQKLFIKNRKEWDLYTVLDKLKKR